MDSSFLLALVVVAGLFFLFSYGSAPSSPQRIEIIVPQQPRGGGCGGVFFAALLIVFVLLLLGVV